MEYPKGQGNGQDEMIESTDQQASQYEETLPYSCSIPIYMAGQINDTNE